MNPWLYLLGTTCAHSCYFPPLQFTSKSGSEEQWSHEGHSSDTRSARHMLPPVNRPCED